MLKLLSKNDSEGFYNNLKKWVLHLNIKEKTFDFYLLQFGSIALNESYNDLQRKTFKEEKSNKSFDYKHLAETLKISRKNYLRHTSTTKIPVEKGKSLNPIS